MNALPNLSIVNVHDAKTNLSKLLDRAHAGEEIILAKSGVPYARLVPYDVVKPQRRTPGGLRVTGDIPDSVWSDPLSDEELRYVDDRPEPR